MCNYLPVLIECISQLFKRSYAVKIPIKILILAFIRLFLLLSDLLFLYPLLLQEGDRRYISLILPMSYTYPIYAIQLTVHSPLTPT